MATQGTIPNATLRNIETIARLEQQYSERRTALDRVSDAVGDFTGSFAFVVIHVAAIAIWFLINTGHFFGLRRFDPYPFVFLSMTVSVEAVLLSTFVLMKQNRMSRKDEHRDHLNLQIDLLAEKEITKILQMQRLICERLGIEEVLKDSEAEEMSRTTSVDQVASELREKLPREKAS
ncbi:MAG TPA: DUF1003 domain-containing protein [Terriglobales bacterium]|jgi:uncharacterized membrane protein